MFITSPVNPCVSCVPAGTLYIAALNIYLQMVDCNVYVAHGASYAPALPETAIDSSLGRRLLAVGAGLPPGTYINRYFGIGEWQGLKGGEKGVCCAFRLASVRGLRCGGDRSCENCLWSSLLLVRFR